MREPIHVVNPETCTGDGICVEVCPENALEAVDEKATTADSRQRADYVVVPDPNRVKEAEGV